MGYIFRESWQLIVFFFFKIYACIEFQCTLTYISVAYYFLKVNYYQDRYIEGKMFVNFLKIIGNKRLEPKDVVSWRMGRQEEISH